MAEIGVFLASEEHGANALVEQASCQRRRDSDRCSSRTTIIRGPTGRARVLSCGASSARWPVRRN